MRRNFQDLTIKDAFMFAAVMSDENQCRKLLEIVLETKILHVTVITEKTMSYHPDYHGVRLDVVAEEEGGHRRFNVEMQVKRTPDLAWRSRYYHSQLDMDALLSGEVYDALPDTYVIFICDFAWMPDQLYRYTYEMVCRENGSRLNQGQKTIFLSTKGRNDGEVSKALTDFLRYVGQPESHCDPSVKDGFVAGLERRIQRIKVSRDWEARFMRLEIELINKWRQGHLEGREEGLREGRKEGRREGRQQVLQETILELLMPGEIFRRMSGQRLKPRLMRQYLSGGICLPQRQSPWRIFVKACDPVW